jgi:hypothetical protein
MAGGIVDQKVESVDACVTKVPIGNVSCGKTVLVDVTSPLTSSISIRMYAIVDDQSSTSFVDPIVFDMLNVSSSPVSFSLTTLDSCRTTKQGHRGGGLFIQGVGGNLLKYRLPDLLTCDQIPDTRSTAASPRTVSGLPHLSQYASNFVEFDPSARVLLLLGRDSGPLLFSEFFGDFPPYAVRSPLGWSMVGIVSDDYLPKEACFSISLEKVDCDHFESHATVPCLPRKLDVFLSHPDDNDLGLSVADRQFLEIVQQGLIVNRVGNIQMPLPFKPNMSPLPNNRTAIFKRTSRTLARVRQESGTLNECVRFMAKSIQAGHVEEVPPEERNVPDGQAWWIPVFPVRHPKKRKLRLVFDSSASFLGVSLNDRLLQGPDQGNRVFGVLVRFREGEIGFVADVESMFHAFHLDPAHRNFLRFFWWAKNDHNRELIEYRANVHIFGNRSSPAVATFGLRFAASDDAATDDARKFVRDNFYVDDGLGCADSVDDAVKVLSETKEILGRFNIRLHKLASSSKSVLQAFPESEVATVDLVTMGDDTDPTPLQRTLGVGWDVRSDRFVVKTDLVSRPFTKRGMLSVVNSLYDPMGLVAPVVLRGRLIQRLVMSSTDAKGLSWDEILPTRFQAMWQEWLLSLLSLHEISIPRPFRPLGFGSSAEVTLHVFCDAAKDAIGHVIYMRSVSDDDHQGVSVAFVCGESRVAPRAAVTIPRLELCAAVAAAQSLHFVLAELSRPVASVTLYTDSRVVLGYIKNVERRFQRYVANRIVSILTVTSADQWRYIASGANPGDIASRATDPSSLAQSVWAQGPDFLRANGSLPGEECVGFDFGDLPEVAAENTVLTVAVNSVASVFDGLFIRCSTWWRLVQCVQCVLMCVSRWCRRCGFANGIDWEHIDTPGLRRRAILTVVRCVQHEAGLSVSSAPRAFRPYFDVVDDVVRAGGRLAHAPSLTNDQRHPLLLPAAHPVSKLLVRHYHARSFHQGRCVTQGAIADAGFVIISVRTILRNILSSCVICRRLRRPLEGQLMADLPPDRLAGYAPFTNTGVDVFGPFVVHHGPATRRTTVSKVWGLLFCCLVSRAVHVELLESMDTASFINALRRFIALRGRCRLIRSDHGTNFVGAKNTEALDFKTVEVELMRRDCEWRMNPPHASHFGGAWERKIGSVRAVLNGVLLTIAGKRVLTREELLTFMLEAVAVVNATPFADVVDDTLRPLTPAAILTLKEDGHPSSADTFSERDVLAYGKRRWRRVQYLADLFWDRWRTDYLYTLQRRRKWTVPQRNLSVGDLVLLRDKAVQRNDWPTGRVQVVYPSPDEMVRKVTVAIVRDGKTCLYDRPVHELVLLMAAGSDDRH